MYNSNCFPCFSGNVYNFIQILKFFESRIDNSHYIIFRIIKLHTLALIANFFEGIQHWSNIKNKN